MFLSSILQVSTLVACCADNDIALFANGGRNGSSGGGWSLHAGAAGGADRSHTAEATGNSGRAWSGTGGRSEEGQRFRRRNRLEQFAITTRRKSSPCSNRCGLRAASAATSLAISESSRMQSFCVMRIIPLREFRPAEVTCADILRRARSRQQEGRFLGKLSALIGPPRRLGANRGPGVDLRVQHGSARTPACPPLRRRDPHRQADSGALIAVRVRGK